MAIHITCINCGSAFEVPDNLADGARCCTKCGATMHIPNSAPPLPESISLKASNRESRFVLVVVGVAVLALAASTLVIVAKKRADDGRRWAEIERVRCELKAQLPLIDGAVAAFQFEEAESIIGEVGTAVRALGEYLLTQEYEEVAARVAGAKQDHSRKVDAGWSLFEGRFVSPDERGRILTKRRSEEEQQLADLRRREAEQLAVEQRQQAEERERRISEQKHQAAERERRTQELATAAFACEAQGCTHFLCAALRDVAKESILKVTVMQDPSARIVHVLFSIDDNLTSAWVVDMAKLKLLRMAEAIHELGMTYDKLLFSGAFPMTDKFGHTEIAEVVRVVYNRSTIEQINWNNWVGAVDAYQVADFIAIHPDFP